MGTRRRPRFRGGKLRRGGGRRTTKPSLSWPANAGHPVCTAPTRIESLRQRRRIAGARKSFARGPAFAEKASAGECNSPPKLRSSERGRARKLGGPDVPRLNRGVTPAPGHDSYLFLLRGGVYPRESGDV